MKKTVFFVTILLITLGYSCTYAVAQYDDTNEQVSPACDSKCGCIGYYVYDEDKQDCVLNLTHLLTSAETRYDSETDEKLFARDGMARSIYIEGQYIFRGILISVILFITCASVCLLSACIYCCRINYSDRKLKREIKALAKEMKKKRPSQREPKPKETNSKSESCNVVVPQAGVFVV